MNPRQSPTLIDFTVFARACLALFVLGCSPSPSPRDQGRQGATDRVSKAPAETDIRSLVASEELILKLTLPVKQLSASMLNLQLPDHASRKLFYHRVSIADLVANTSPTPVPGRDILSSESRQWQVARHASQTSERPHVDMWRPLLSDVAYFEHARFSIVRGTFLGAGFGQFETEIGFEGLARTHQGRWRSVKARQQVRWQRSPERVQDQMLDWQITSWRLTSLSTRDSPRLLFTETLNHLLPNEADRRRARESLHWRFTKRHYYPRINVQLPGRYRDSRFFAISTAMHPGLAVVDIDRDGLDDLYVTVRWGQNMLFRNRGDGTLEEVAAQYGLDIDGRSNAAVFADFDNDGDADLFLARSLDRSMYLVNEDGRFVDRSRTHISVPLPFQATSVSAADYNRDGLLDVYLSTYHQDDVSTRIDADLSHPDHAIHKLLSDEESRELIRRYKRENRSFLTQVGPPNVLLLNRGDGHFDLAPENDSLAIWRNSFQGTWSDFDDDGDPDLYVANDFSTDHLFRNDMPDGFVDVSEPSRVNEISFSMGASWGDYDNDGQLDLYVSNMYSKAGQRITSQIKGLDPRFASLAAGNYLYNNHGDHFVNMSSGPAHSMKVAKAGWSWGGQFVDVDNDGYLDIYVSSGYYSVPEEYSTKIDL